MSEYVNLRAYFNSCIFWIVWKRRTNISQDDFLSSTELLDWVFATSPTVWNSSWVVCSPATRFPRHRVFVFLPSSNVSCRKAGKTCVSPLVPTPELSFVAVLCVLSGQDRVLMPKRLVTKFCFSNLILFLHKRKVCYFWFVHVPVWKYLFFFFLEYVFL